VKAAVAWSGGKDCAWALRRVGLCATHLITTFDESSGLVPIHNVPLGAIRRQAEALRMELIAVPLPASCPNTIYVDQFGRACAEFDTLVFGDLFLQDIREFRERSFVNMTLEFPLWGQHTGELAREMIDGGLRATVTAARNPALIGRRFDYSLLADLPEETDPCGENGEFHTWVEPECLVSFR